MLALIGQDVGDARRAQRDQQREGGFRAVCGRAQGVQAENRNARGSADLLGALVPIRQRLSKQNIEDGHAHLRATVSASG